MFDCLVEVRRSNMYQVLTKRKNALREKNKKKIAEHEFSFTGERIVSHREKQFRGLLPLGGSRASGMDMEEALLGDFGTCPCQSRAR